MRVIAPDPEITVPLPGRAAAPLPGTFVRSHRGNRFSDPRAAVAVALIAAGTLLCLGALLAFCALAVLVRVT